MTKDRPMGERVTAVEVALQEHVKSCERTGAWNFRLILVVLGLLLAIIVKQYGFS